MRSTSRVQRLPLFVAATFSLLAGLMIAPQTAAASSICESGTQPDGSVVVCFLSVGTSTWRVPDGVTSIQYLVVGGGGGGGADNAGGGGGGGFVEGTASVTPGSSLRITVGDGGKGATVPNTRGRPGLPSSIQGIAAADGGGEGGTGHTSGSTSLRNGGDGGAGGGAGGEGNGAGGQATAGNVGGATTGAGTSQGGGGGGGATSQGSATNTSAGGNGGDGRPSNITGRPEAFAGGGGGGADNNLTTSGGGGAGGGGAGGLGGAGDPLASRAQSGVNGRGGGGGGAATRSATPDRAIGGDGGSGIVVIRYSFSGYVIRIEPNEGTCTTTMVSGAPNSSVRLPGAEACTRDGYELVGFDFTATGAGTAFGPGATVTLTRNMTLYAIWTKVFTLTIEPNGGTCSVTKITGQINTWVNLPGAGACTRPDYGLIGFNVAADGSGAGFAPGAPVQLTSDNRMYAIWKQVGPTPFVCSADLYQVSGTGGGVLYVYDPARNTMDLVPSGGGRSKAGGANAIGYNPADNFIYGIAPNGSSRHLWQFGSNGVYQDLGPILLASGQPVSNLSLISGDFIDADTLLAIQTPRTVLVVDIAPTRNGSSAIATQLQAPSNAWGAADIAFNADRTAGYGMGANVLYVMTLPGAGSGGQLAAPGQSGAYSRKTVLGVPLRGTYGASYLDQNNNAYFYNNEERRIYLITASELSKAQPTAVPLGTERAFVLGTDQTLLTPTDGASCPTAPIVTVTLTYRMNGGRGTAPNDQVGFVDQSVTVADGIGFSRDNFTFVGWNSSADGSGTSYPPGALYSLGASGGVLFAQWAPIEAAPEVPPANTLEPLVVPTPPNEQEEPTVIFTPIKDLPAPPNDPWQPSSVVLVDPDRGNVTPVVQDDSGDWSVNSRTGDVKFVPDPAFSGIAKIAIQLQTESGVRYESTLQTRVPSCQRGPSLRATVYFDVLSSQLDAKSKRTLDRLIRKASRTGLPTCTAVVGYVQPTVNRANDTSLSKARSSSVADYLKKRGIDRIIRNEGLGRADEQGARARRATARIYIAQIRPPAPLDEATG